MPPEDPVEMRRRQVPLSADVADEVLKFWEEIFPESAARFRHEHAGQEAGHNRDVLYLARLGGRDVPTVWLERPAERTPETRALPVRRRWALLGAGAVYGRHSRARQAGAPRPEEGLVLAFTWGREGSVARSERLPWASRGGRLRVVCPEPSTT